MMMPTVGRVVWFYLSQKQKDLNIVSVRGDQPFAATIAYVYNERQVNLSIVDHSGEHFAQLDVQLLQDDDPPPPDLEYCTWMPYQVGQAAKTEQLERQISTGTDRAEYAGLKRDKP